MPAHHQPRARQIGRREMVENRRSQAPATGTGSVLEPVLQAFLRASCCPRSPEMRRIFPARRLASGEGHPDSNFQRDPRCDAASMGSGTLNGPGRGDSVSTCPASLRTGAGLRRSANSCGPRRQGPFVTVWPVLRHEARPGQNRPISWALSAPRWQEMDPDRSPLGLR
jgi:hypothetical protein